MIDERSYSSYKCSIGSDDEIGLGGMLMRALLIIVVPAIVVITLRTLAHLN
jgi:hypothetical protein